MSNGTTVLPRSMKQAAKTKGKRVYTRLKFSHELCVSLYGFQSCRSEIECICVLSEGSSEGIFDIGCT